MKKSFKYSMAALLTVSVVTPVIASAATSSTVQDIVITIDDINYKIDIVTYGDLLDSGKAKDMSVKYIKASTGVMYSIGEFNDALDASGGVAASALNKLAAGGTPVSIPVEDAEFDNNGEIITGVNSSFFVKDIY